MATMFGLTTPPLTNPTGGLVPVEVQDPVDVKQKQDRVALQAVRQMQSMVQGLHLAYDG